MNSGKIIATILEDFPEARDSDRVLMIKVWEKQMGKPMHPRLMSFFLETAISPETIRRTRQKLQEEGKYKASEEVEEARYEKFKQARFEIVDIDGERVARII